MTVIVLIPAYNEAQRIAATVQAAASIPGVTQVIVVDDGSTDDTFRCAQAAGATVLAKRRNSGKGAALNLGLEAVTATLRHQDSAAIMLLDGDLGASATGAAALLEPILAGQADMTIGILPPPARKVGFGRVKQLAREAIRKYGDGFEASAPLSGQRAMTPQCLEAVTPFAAGFGVEAVMTIRALQAGLKVLELPIAVEHRASGRDLAGLAHRTRQYLEVRKALSKL
ncbi:MAG: glycosyltransferase family 2 protein [Coriobacteriales bacterium]|jgi:glycosyltransferase involved in cell wall biosynthesis|nr:glycosyltransferase family 2 protein [Coriobacteriales bacterium]